MRKTLFLSITVILVVNFSFGYFSTRDKGTSGAQFLKIGPGARAVGMGEAFGAIADDVTAIYWNPSGLAQLTKREVSFMHAIWFESINYDFLAYAHPLKGNNGTISGSFTLLTMGGIQRVDNTGSETGLGKFSPYDLSFNIAYARKVKMVNPVRDEQLPDSNGVNLGMAIKIVRQKIDESATAFGADIGALYVRNRLSIGFAFQNFGTKVKFRKEGFSLPLNIKLGVAYKLLARPKHSLQGALDLNAPVDNQPNAHLGFEYGYIVNKDWKVAGRVGFKTNTLSDINAGSGLAFGLGFNYNIFGLDFGFAPYGKLGQVYRVSLGVKF